MNDVRSISRAPEGQSGVPTNSVRSRFTKDFQQVLSMIPSRTASEDA